MIRPVMPLFEYIIEQDYIAEFLCVNTDKPELDCGGKCYLMQQLAKHNEEKRQNLPRIAMEEYPIGFVQLLSIVEHKFIESFNTITSEYLNEYRYLFSYSDFRPPSLTF